MADGDDPQAPLRRFAAEVAHELNNVLTAVLGLAEKLETEAHADDDVRQQISLIAAHGRRLKHLSERLSGFSRGGDLPGLETQPAGHDVPPLSMARAAPKPRLAGRPQAPTSVLLVEDEEVVRDIVAWQLEGMGYQVLAAHSAESALALFEAEREQIDLALIDVILPGRSGLQLAEDLRRRKPELPVIILSGASSEEHEASRDIWLEKPVPLQRLQRAVAEALAQAPTVRS